MSPNEKSKESNEDFELVEINLTESTEESLKRKRKISKSQSLEEQSINSLRSTGSDINPFKTSNNVDEDSNGVAKKQNIERKRSVSSLVDELLYDIYSKIDGKRRISVTTCDLSWQDSDCGKYCRRYQVRSSPQQIALKLMTKDIKVIKEEAITLQKLILEEGNKLIKHLKRKDFLLMKRETHYDVITAYLQAISNKTREDTKMKFSLAPGSETGFSQWLDAMKMVAQLPGGMPPEFRTKLWLQLSEKHLQDKNIDWEKAEVIIFNEWTNPDDEELGVQIVKDLHRTGCSLFCGAQEHNQALLKRVLLAYARWNKNVGYCQGFNMLAALILQVMEKDEKKAVKVMIYLIEGVLPESYFANNLRGLSVDMAVFRDLLRLRLPKLSKHLEALQHDTNAGSSYEPPLTNVFTMQWFLTLFSNCLPQQTVLRVWDLVFLNGNEVLLRTALAIWGILQDRIMTVESADEFYSIMGVVTREMLEFGLMDANNLVKTIVMVDPFPNELQELREKYLYNISPWTQSVQSAAKKGIKLFYSDPEDQDDTEDEDKIALATAYGVFRRRESTSREIQPSGPTLDISILKQQYAKLRQRQRQAHIIISAACSSNLTGNMTASPSVSVNHLLMGKSALVNKGRRIGPPEGSIPPPPNNRKGESSKKPKVVISGETLHWKDAEKKKTTNSQNKNKSNTDAEATSNKTKHVNMESCNGGRNIRREEEYKLNTNHDRMKNIGDESVGYVTEKSVEESFRKRELSHRKSSSSSSSSTELCDDEFHRYSDFDSEDATNSDASGYQFKENLNPDMMQFESEFSDSIKDVQTLTANLSTIPSLPEMNSTKKELKIFSADSELKIKRSSSEIIEIENCAVDLINEIEERLQDSIELKFLAVKETTTGIGINDNLDSGDFNEEMMKSPDEESLKTSSSDNITKKFFVNNNNIDSLDDNILKPEPEVPISSNDNKNSNDVICQMEKQIPHFFSQTIEPEFFECEPKIEKLNQNRRKSDLASSVIEENLKMLCKLRTTAEANKKEEEEEEEEVEKIKEEIKTDLKRNKKSPIDEKIKLEIEQFNAIPDEKIIANEDEAEEVKPVVKTEKEILRVVQKAKEESRAARIDVKLIKTDRKSDNAEDEITKAIEKKKELARADKTNEKSLRIGDEEERSVRARRTVDADGDELPNKATSGSKAKEEMSENEKRTVRKEKEVVKDVEAIKGVRVYDEKPEVVKTDEDEKKTAKTDKMKDEIMKLGNETEEMANSSKKGEEVTSTSKKADEVITLNEKTEKIAKVTSLIHEKHLEIFKTDEKQKEFAKISNKVEKVTELETEITNRSRLSEILLTGKDSETDGTKDEPKKSKSVGTVMKTSDESDHKFLDKIEEETFPKSIASSDATGNYEIKSPSVELEKTESAKSPELKFNENIRKDEFVVETRSSLGRKLDAKAEEFSYELSKSPERRLRIETSPLKCIEKRSEPEGIEFKRDSIAWREDVAERWKKESEKMKTKIEISKSDWELKMKKIAELETTTREKLSEIQAKSERFRRRPLHRSLDRTDGEHRRIHSEIGEGSESGYAGTYTPSRSRTRSPRDSSAPEIEVLESTFEDRSNAKRKLKISTLSFDEITSRTEKLLKSSEFNKSVDEKCFGSNKIVSPIEFSRKISPDFGSAKVSPEYKKPKDSTLKFKQLIEESYGGDEDEFVFLKTSPGKRREFYSSPTSPDYQSKSKIRYSDYVSPKKFSVSPDSSKKGKYQDENEDWLRITQDDSKSRIELIDHKEKDSYSPDFRKPDSSYVKTPTSFNPFPTRSPLRPKELGVKLGMYPSDGEYFSKKS